MSRNRFLLLLVALLALATPASAQVTITYTFTNQTTADADQVNTNFSTLASQALNRTGGTLTGNIAANAGVTIDGVDVGAVLGGTGTPTFASLTVSGGITAGSGVVGIIGATGKIPALTSTYFTSLAFDSANLTGTAAAINGSAITALNATQLTTGTVPLARLSGITNTEIAVGAAIAWTKIDKTGSSLADLATRTHTQLSDGASVAMLNAAATFTDILGISTKYWSDTSSTTATITTPNSTVAPGNSSIVYLSNADPANSIQTISGGVEGRVIHICNTGSSFIFSAGGNMVGSSGGIAAGQCSTLIFHSTLWYYFD